MRGECGHAHGSLRLQGLCEIKRGCMMVWMRVKVSGGRILKVPTAKSPNRNFDLRFSLNRTNSNDVRNLRSSHHYKRLFELYTLILISANLVGNSLCSNGLKFACRRDRKLVFRLYSKGSILR